MISEHLIESLNRLNLPGATYPTDKSIPINATFVERMIDVILGEMAKLRKEVDQMMDDSDVLQDDNQIRYYTAMKFEKTRRALAEVVDGVAEDEVRSQAAIEIASVESKIDALLADMARTREQINMKLDEADNLKDEIQIRYYVAMELEKERQVLAAKGSTGEDSSQTIIERSSEGLSEKKPHAAKTPLQAFGKGVDHSIIHKHSPPDHMGKLHSGGSGEGIQTIIHSR